MRKAQEASQIMKVFIVLSDLMVEHKIIQRNSSLCEVFPAIPMKWPGDSCYIPLNTRGLDEKLNYT
jgi:hypothetical protein